MMNAGSFRALAAVAAVALLCSCTKTAEQSGGQAEPTGPQTHFLRFSDGSNDLNSLNSHLFTETNLGYISQLSQAYLVRYGSDNRPYPELVTIVPTQANGGISKDGKTITWHLRKGLKWSDGVPFDADDVIFSTHAVLNPANNEVGRDGWNLITSMDEPDKYTVVYHLSKPYASYIPTFFGSAGANPTVLPKHILGGLPNINNAPYNSKPVGIGPFRVTEWRRGESVELEANPYYFRGLPKLHRVSYKIIPSRDTLLTLMQTGEIDLWPQVPSSYIKQVLNVTKLQTDIHGSPYYAHLTFNVTRPLMTDVRVRQAIRYAIDRDSLAQKITQGHSIVWEGVVPPVVPIAPKLAMVPYDPDKAKALLDAAGWKPGPDGVRMKNGQRLSLEFPYYTGVSTADDTVEFIRAALRPIGVEIQTRKYAPAVFFAPYQNNGIVYGSKWDMTMFAWQSDPVGDISNNWECDEIPPNGQNISHLCNPQLDALLERFKVTYDENTHRQLLGKEVQLIDDNVPAIVLYVLEDGDSHNRNLTGFNPGAWTPFDNMMNVDI